ncbi:hypothetical protein C463_17373 [Halorubrum californiense DSM 19288]|uniref:Uncharacterized protein n=1 Tax=Halorubrum californiense DSM 19288 TaxID=1227465 RepID=M0DWV9_9EURY|nr:hypothetical protein [Halorubrum californiense]ELZ39212.1 hypothetical protein C463_17373 [Halorubrum californiense DSM 19288]
MTHTYPSITRRSVLTTVAAGSLTVAGCSESRAPATTGAGAITEVRVDDTTLVVEYDADTSATGLAVIAPSGEAFAERELTPGASQESIPIGTTYPPGTYTVQLVDADSVVAAVERSLRPEVVIRELKLARNHPEEMYEGATNQVVRTETMLHVENQGSGPEKLVQLRFDGYVPRPTPEQSDDSGIVVVDDQPEFHTEPVIDPGTSVELYSREFPFSSSSQEASCEPNGSDGQFTVTLVGSVSGDSTQQTYEVTYEGEDLLTCDISIQEGEL